MLRTNLNAYAIAASSEEKGFDKEKILSMESGWLTKRDARPPHYIIIGFGDLALVTHLQLIAHKKEIPQRVDIHISDSNFVSSIDDLSLRRVGYVSFHSNKDTNYTGRELKTVEIRKVCQFIKLELNGCFRNEFNASNSVGFIHINAVGEYVENIRLDLDRPIGSAHSQRESESLGPSMTPQKSLFNEMFSMLEMKKKEAVAEEDFESARMIKLQLEKIQAISPEIKRLEEEKQAALEREDYDAAKKLKQRLDATLYRVGVGQGNGAARPITPVMAVQVEHMNGMPASQVARGTPLGAPVGVDGVLGDSVPIRPASNDIYETADENSDPFGTKGTKMRSATPQSQQGPPQRQVESPRTSAPQNNTAMSSDPDERPIAQMKGDQFSTAVSPEEVGEAENKDVNAELPPPEPLSKAKKKELAGVVTFFETEAVKCLGSKNRKLREKGAQDILAEIKAGQHGSSKSSTFPAAVRIVEYLLKDPIATVCNLSVEFVQVVLETFSSVSKAQWREEMYSLVEVVSDAVAAANPRKTENLWSVLNMVLNSQKLPVKTFIEHFCTVSDDARAKGKWKPVLRN